MKLIIGNVVVVSCCWLFWLFFLSSNLFDLWSCTGFVDWLGFIVPALQVFQSNDAFDVLSLAEICDS